MPDLQERFLLAVAEIMDVEVDEVRMDRTWEDLGADSLALVELSLLLDDAFGIRLPEVDPEDMQTVGQAFALVEAAVAAQAS